MTNGTVTNGIVTNGKVTNGTVTNGTATNVTITNGTVTNGTRAKVNGQSANIMRNTMDDKWIMIQKSTFTNWVNEQLKADNECITDLKTDLSNGVRLIKLVNRLQQPSSKIARRYFRVPTNQHQCLENVSLALNAITEDGIRLVNIGKQNELALLQTIVYLNL